MGRRLLILFLMLATAVTTSAIAVGVSNDLVTNCDEGHTWEDSSVLVEADCTTKGVLLQECSVCGEKQEVAIDATGHEYGEFTSNGNGTHSKVCANDDDHVVTENCSGGEATCTEKATCSVCGEKYGAELLHTYNVEKATPEYLKEEATCVTKAQYYYSCECGAKDVRWFEYGEYAPHVYKYEIAEPEHLKTPADCTHDAVYYLSCECTASGDDAYTFVAEGTMGEHSFRNTTVKDATTLVSEATCTAHAIYKYTCTGCDAIGTETYEGEILNHEMTYHAAVEATCKVEGFVEYWACATCSKNYDAEQGGTEIENVSLGLNANNHKNIVVTKEAQASTCTVAGWTKEETCNDCNVVVTVSEALEKSAHVGSTTEVNGCANCDHVFTVAEIVEMAKALASGKSLTGKFELTGVISKITYAAGASNISVDMVVENGDNDLTINCYKLNGNGFSVLAVGDTITVQGLIKNYNGTIEFDGSTATNCVLVSSLHSVTTETAENGSVSVNVNEQVALGTEVVVTVTPDAGYEVAAVKVNGVAIEAVEGVYKFNVEKSTIVEAIFVEEGASVVLPYVHTFAKGQCALGDNVLTGVNWNIAGIGSTYFGWDTNATAKGIQFGKSAEPFTSLTLTSASFDNVAKVVINTSGANGISGSFIVKVNGTQVGEAVTLTTTATTYEFVLDSVTSGAVEFVYTNSAKAIYIKEIQVHFGEAEEACAHANQETLEAVEPTCTATGLTEGKKCTDCGEIITAQETVDALGHTEETLEAVAADCTNTGLTEGKKCSVCGEVLVAQTVVDALGHNMVTDAAVEPTCTTTGLTEGSHCSRCDGATTAQETVDALGHSMTYHPAVQANCQADGNVEYWACSVCEKNYNAEENGEVIENVTVVDKDNHTDLITLDAVAATCTETGLTEGQKCNACGVTTIKQDIVPALNHIDENSDNICDRTDCGAVMCDGSHIWEDKKDETMHWEECSACHEIQNAETHNYVNPEYRVVDGALKLVSTCVCGEEKVEDVEEEVIEVSSEKDLATVLSAGVDVVLTEDVTLTEGSLEITKSVNVDLNGNDILVNGVKGDVCEAFYVRGEGVEVTITNAGDVIANTDSEDAEHIIVVSATEGAIVNIQGGNFVSYGCSTIYANTGAVINIYGGRYEAKELYYGVNYLLDIKESVEESNRGIINVYGGEFVGFNPANHTNDGTYTNKVANGYHSIYDAETDVYTVIVHDYDEVVTAPNCTTAGYTTYTCVCGDTYEVAGADALGHEYGELNEKVDATCSKEGMEAHYFCDVCDTYFDAEKNTTTADALTIDKDPNAHAYGEWTTVDGNHSRVCANDNTHTESGACADENADDKCDVCSADMPVALVEKTLSFASADQRVSSSTTEQVWKQNGITLVYAKGSYNNNLAEYNNPARFYAGTQITITAGTGIKKIVFNCNSTSYATELKNSIGAAATVSEKVVTVGLADLPKSYTFSPAAQVRVDSIVVTFKECAHANTETIETTPATCDTAGVTGGVYCNDCGCYTTEEGGKPIPALGHDYAYAPAQDSDTHLVTCVRDNCGFYTTEGCDGGTATCKAQAICEKCSQSYGELGNHNFGDGTTCTVCGEEKTGDEPVLTEKEYTYTFTAAQWKENAKEYDGVSKTLNSVTWTLSGTGSYLGYDGTKGQQFGSGSKPYKSLTLTSASFSNVSKITINTSGASSVNASFVVTVGGTPVGSSQKITATATDYTFTPDAAMTGAVAFTYTQTSSKAIYIKSITIEYAE